MIIGVSTATYTLIHVLISLVGIGSGLIVMFGFLTGRQLNGMTAIFFRHYGVNERNRFRLSGRASTALPHCRDYLAPGIGGRDSGALHLSSRRSLALDLCGYGCHCPLPECLRFSGAAFREGACSESLGSYSEGSAIRDRTAHRNGNFCRSHHCCGKEISRSANPHGLIRIFLLGLQANTQSFAADSSMLNELAALQFSHRLAQLLLGVHHDRAVPSHGLLNRLAGHQQKANSVGASLHRQFISAVE